MKQDNFAGDAESTPSFPSTWESPFPCLVMAQVTVQAQVSTEHPSSCKVSQAQGTLLSTCTQLLAINQQLQVLPPLARIPNAPLPLSGDFEESQAHPRFTSE